MQWAIVSETYPPEVNGVALTVAGAVAGLRARGHRVDVIRPVQAHEQPGEADDELRVPAFKLPRYAALRVGRPCTRALIERWKHSRPDAVYVATEGPLGWCALTAARRLRIPAATGLHTRFDDYMRSYGLRVLEPVALAWMRLFHARGDATLVPTEELAQWLTQRGFQRVHRMPRAVDCGRFRPEARDAALRRIWGLGPRDVAVLHFGRFAAEKNLGLAVAAFEALEAQWQGPQRLRMVWVGDGPERAALQAAHPHHVFCGMQTGDALARHVASTDLFLFPSRSETFGNVVLEAMASGLPVIAFDRAAAREHLRDGEHGACVQDDAAFVRGALQYGLDADARLRAGVAARIAMETLDGDATVAAYESHLLRLARMCELPRAQLADATP